MPATSGRSHISARPFEFNQVFLLTNGFFFLLLKEAKTSLILHAITPLSDIQRCIDTTLHRGAEVHRYREGTTLAVFFFEVSNGTAANAGHCLDGGLRGRLCAWTGVN